MTELYSLQDIARLPAPGDNAAIATRRLERGTQIQFNDIAFVLDADVLEGHRFAVRPIARDDGLSSWGYRFGIAIRDILPGNYVVNGSVLAALRERNVTLSLPDAPNFRNHIEPYHFDENAFVPGVQVAPYPHPRTFLGYRRPAGRGVGTRSVIVIMGLSSRAASYARALAIRLQPAAEGFENIDGVAAVAHTEGSGADPINNYEILVRTLAGMMVHPNVGAVLAVSHPDDAVTEREMRAYLEQNNYPIDAVPHAWLTLGGDLQDNFERGGQIVKTWFADVNQTARTPESLAHLKIALQCGGSDAFSGVSGNPLVGAVAREIVRYGGTANLGETDELITAEEYVLKNVRDAATAHAFLEAVKVFQARLAWHGVTAEGNPSGGNMYRGLYNISLKSLGAAMKKDPAVRLDRVIQYAERMSAPGFYFMDSPGNDLEGIAGQVAAGCNLIFFTTGNGSVTNFPFVPTIKVVTTTGRYNLLPNEMDVNAGAYLDGTPFDDLTSQTLDLTVRIVSGEKSKGEKAQHSQVSIWRNWRQTDARSVNVLLEMPTPNGEPIPLHPVPNERRFVPTGMRPLAYPIYDDGKRIAHEFVGLVLPTSLCASQVARLTAEKLNAGGIGQPEHLARFVALTHTEGCGVSGDSYFALYKRTLVNYMLHPMVRWGLFLEHGCEITHNDSMRRRLQEMGGDPDQFGWASIQLDGGIEQVQKKVAAWFDARITSAKRLRRELVTGAQLRIGLMVSSPPPPAIAAALVSLARNLVQQGGTLILPSTSPLLVTDAFGQLLGGETKRATLAYGQFAARHGFHIMDAPSHHWVETTTGLGATGVELIVAYVDPFPQQAHPFIPMLQFTHAKHVSFASLQNFDLVLGDIVRNVRRNVPSDERRSVHSDERHNVPYVEQIEAGMLRMLAHKITPRAWAQDNSDFQITRGLLGVTV